MRTTQFYGLHEKAIRFLDSFGSVLLFTISGTKAFPDGRTEPYEHKEVVPAYGTADSGEIIYGVCGEEIPLSKYTLPNGKVLFERKQLITYSSGPMIYTALQNEKGEWIKETLWPAKELGDAGVFEEYAFEGCIEGELEAPK